MGALAAGGTHSDLMQQFGFGLHTTSSDLGLALDDCQGNQRHQVWSLGRALSTHLHVYLAEFIQPQTWADLAFLGVARGPGSFTGTRVGVVTARTLAQQLNIPLFAISTLAALAWTQQPCLVTAATGTLPDIAVQMPAQRGEVFGAIYKLASDGAGLVTLLPDSVFPVEQWLQTLESWPTAYHLLKAEGGLGHSVTGLLALANLDWQQGRRPHWSEALPFYGQAPVATVPRH